MSARRNCSGAMYRSFPLISPSWVVSTRFAARAMPKSATRAMPSTPMRMFCGETSRCTISSDFPCSLVASWAACRPYSTSDAMRAVTSSGSGSPLSRAAISSLWSETPCTYSITRSSSPASSTTSSVWTTFGCLTSEVIRASSTNIPTTRGSPASAALIRLIATVSETPRAARILPRYTVPMPPVARGCTIS